MNDVTELLSLLVSQYQTKQFRVDGAQEQSVPAPLDQLDAEFTSGRSPATQEERSEQLAARRGIEHFVAFCRQFLKEHPPETHIMLAQGFGVRLTGGYDVSLTPTQYESLGGQLEDAPSYAVTVGMGHPAMRGVESSPSYAVTGEQAHPGLRGPGA